MRVHFIFKRLGHDTKLFIALSLKCFFSFLIPGPLMLEHEKKKTPKQCNKCLRVYKRTFQCNLTKSTDIMYHISLTLNKQRGCQPTLQEKARIRAPMPLLCVFSLYIFFLSLLFSRNKSLTITIIIIIIVIRRFGPLQSLGLNPGAKLL